MIRLLHIIFIVLLAGTCRAVPAKTNAPGAQPDPVDHDQPLILRDDYLEPFQHDMHMQFKDSARSWEQLLKEAKPACTWGDRDLLWVKEDARGVEALAVDEAYIYRSSKGLDKWVTLLAKSDSTRHLATNSVMYVRVRAEILKPGAPQPGATEPFARKLLQDPKQGAVYEIQWPCLPCHYPVGWRVYCRRIFCLRSPSGHWRVLGESGGGGEGYAQALAHWSEINTSTAQWTGRKRDPVRIIQTSDVLRFEPGNESEGLLLQGQCVLEGPDLEAVVHPEPTHIAHRAGETLEDVVDRVTLWLEDLVYSPGEASRDGQVYQRWLKAVRKANPTIKDGPVPVDQPIVLPRWLDK